MHGAALADVIERFGQGTPRRVMLGRRLQHIYELAHRTGCVARFILFGSFITEKPEPNDVDIFLLMEDTFDVNMIQTEQEYETTLERVARFQKQIEHLRKTEANPQKSKYPLARPARL